MLLLSFFRYPQGLLMVLLVGMIAPSLIAVDMRSRAYLLYFSRPITPVEYILGKALVVWAYLAAVTTLPALVLYVLGVLLSPSLSVLLYTWDLPFRILAASLVLMLPTTSLALFFSSMTTESRYAGFSWFALWALGWTAYANLNVVHQSPKWGMLSLYHVLGRVQEWVFGLAPVGHDAVPCAILLAIVTVMPFVVLASRVVCAHARVRGTMIQLDSVTKLYGTVIGVNDINMSLSPGAYGLVGPNGSGKTTLLNLITGQLRPTIGTVRVLGQSPWNRDALLRMIGLCPAVDVLYPNVSALEWVSYLVETAGVLTAATQCNVRGSRSKRWVWGQPCGATWAPTRWACGSAPSWPRPLPTIPAC